MQTSVFAASWRALYRILGATSWPAVPTINDQEIGVYLRGTGKDDPLESVIVQTIAQSNDSINWAELGALDRDEQLTVPIRVDTTLRNRTEDQVTDRLEALVATVEQTVWGACQIGAFPAEFAVNGASRLKWWRVAAITSEVYALEAGGCAGYADLTIAIQARLRGR